MTDKELLELAALAAGYGPVRMADDDSGLLLYGVQEPWNPLVSDSDALRLAVKLEIDLCFYTERDAKVYAQTKHLLGYGTDDTPSYQAHEYYKEPYEGSDPYAATRRAIVRASAAIGEKI